MAATSIQKPCDLILSLDDPHQNRSQTQHGVGSNSLLQEHSLNLRAVAESKSYDIQCGESDLPNSMPPPETEQKQTSVSCESSIPTEGHQGSLKTIPCCHTLVIFLNGLLVGILQAEYQSKTISPFSEHPANMWIFVGSICSYCLGLAFKLQLQHSLQPSSTYRHMIDGLVLISAVVSPLSLVLIFLHCSAAWLYSVISIISVILVTHHRLVVTCRGVYEKILNYFRALPVPKLPIQL